MYPIVINRLNINPLNLRIFNPIGDGNYLFRCISHFLYGSEDLYMYIRREIQLRMNSYQDITIDTENGLLHFRDYIPKIIWDGFYGGELEINIAANIYNINIATFNEVSDNNLSQIGYTIINYYNNNDDNQNRHLMIWLNYNNIHFRMGYYNINTILDLNFHIPAINNNEENITKEDEIIDKTYFTNTNIFSN